MNKCFMHEEDVNEKGTFVVRCFRVVFKTARMNA